MGKFKCAIEESGRGKQRCKRKCASCKIWYPTKRQQRAQRNVTAPTR